MTLYTVAPLKTVLNQLDLLGEEVVPTLRKELAARRGPEVPDAPTHASLVKAEYGDQPPRQPPPQRRPRRQRHRRLPLPGHRPDPAAQLPEPVMASRTRLANDAWEALLSAHARLMKQFAAEDSWQDLSMREYDVLYTLSKSREPVRMGELHRHVLLSQPALSRMVDRLVERGLVERCPDPADRRGVRLSLTDAGRDIQRQVGRRHARSVARALTAELSPDELRQLAAIGWKLAGRPAATGASTTNEKELART